MILEHLGMVRAIARRIQQRLPCHVPLEDLVSTGIIGLIHAVDNYDPAQGAKLITYADFKIRGAILDSLRKEDGLTRQGRKRHRQINEAIAKLEQKLQRVPKDEEVALELSLTLETYYDWKASVQGLQVQSADAESDIYENITRLRLIVDDKDLPSVVAERREMEAILTEEIQTLPPMERTVLSLYCEHDLAPQEIAQIVGIKSTRVSQIRCQAVVRLRASINRRFRKDKHRS